MIQLSPLRGPSYRSRSVSSCWGTPPILNVHPIFRWFNIEPPAFIRKFIRQQSKKGDDFCYPSIPGCTDCPDSLRNHPGDDGCRHATGDRCEGAALMFAFVLGTSPVFFVVAYFATQLGSNLEKYFMKLVAVVVMVLAIVTINTGLNLIGSPFSLNRIFQNPSEANAQANSVESASLLPLPPLTTNPTAGCNCGIMKNRQGILGSGPVFSVPTPTALPAPAESDSSEWNEVTVKVLNSEYSPNVVKNRSQSPNPSHSREQGCVLLLARFRDPISGCAAHTGSNRP